MRSKTISCYEGKNGDIIKAAPQIKATTRHSSFFKPEEYELEEHVFPQQIQTLPHSQLIDPDIIIEGMEESKHKILNHEIVESANAHAI